MSTITIEITGLPQLERAFTEVQKRLENLKPLWDRFASEFYSQEVALFASQPWKPLSPAYTAAKQKKYGDKPILRATDTLYHSLTQKNAEGSVYRTEDQSAEFGSSVPYGVFHAETRPPIGEPDVNRYETLVGKYVAELVREAGFN